MGNIPTIVVVCLAAALTIMYFVLPSQLQFAMLIFMAASYFLVIILWLADKSERYMHNLGGGYGHAHDEKKKLATNYSEHQHTLQIGSSEINEAKAELSADLEDLRSSLQNKDAEIEDLKAEIANLNTQVEIEKLRAELANLKALAAKQGSKKK
jgi:septal ring factor EnvC (AmiA/AmiB activator)